MLPFSNQNVATNQSINEVEKIQSFLFTLCIFLIVLGILNVFLFVSKLSLFEAQYLRIMSIIL